MYGGLTCSIIYYTILSCHLTFIFQAVCCSDHVHCCPNGFTCHPSGQCFRHVNAMASSGRALSSVSTTSLLLESSSKDLISKVVCPDKETMCPKDTTCCQTGNQKYPC